MSESIGSVDDEQQDCKEAEDQILSDIHEWKSSISYGVEEV